MAAPLVTRPPVIHFCPSSCSELFSIDYNGQQQLTTCQKIAIIFASIFGLILGGLALSYYWRTELYEKHLRIPVSLTDTSFALMRSKLSAPDAPLFLKCQRVPPSAQLIPMLPTERAARQSMQMRNMKSTQGKPNSRLDEYKKRFSKEIARIIQEKVDAVKEIHKKGTAEQIKVAHEELEKYMQKVEQDRLHPKNHTIPHHLFHYCILQYLECPMEDSSLRRTCHYFSTLYPQRVDLSFIHGPRKRHWSLEEMNACVNSYQKNRSVIHALRIDKKIHHNKRWLLNNPALFSLKKLEGPLVLSFSEKLCLSIEEWQFDITDRLSMYKIVFGLLPKLKNLKSLSMLNVSAADEFVLPRLIEYAKTHLKKLKISNNPLYSYNTTLIIHSLPQLLGSSLEEIDLIFSTKKESASTPDSLDFDCLRSLTEEILNQIEHSPTRVQVNGHILSRSTVASLLNSSS